MYDMGDIGNRQERDLCAVKRATAGCRARLWACATGFGLGVMLTSRFVEQFGYVSGLHDIYSKVYDTLTDANAVPSCILLIYSVFTEYIFVANPTTQAKCNKIRVLQGAWLSHFPASGYNISLVQCLYSDIANPACIQSVEKIPLTLSIGG
jgi:hypothetical protein